MDGTSFTCRAGKDDIELEAMITDADFFVDALFNSLGSQSAATELYQVWILYCLCVVLSCQQAAPQPSLDDLMDLDPMAPLQDWLSSRLPETVDNSLLWRGKSQTPDQEPVVTFPPTDIKDIHVTTSYHPFSHAALRDVAGYRHQDQPGPGHQDQPSTSTQYPPSHQAYRKQAAQQR